MTKYETRTGLFLILNGEVNGDIMKQRLKTGLKTHFLT